MDSHSYEEIQKATSEVLLNDGWMRDINQYLSLKGQVEQVLRERDGYFTREDGEAFREVFSELFRSGIIIMGLNESNPNFPFFTFSRYGKQFLKEKNPYFFHDVSSYEKVIRESIPDVDPLTILYLKEAMQAFRSGCILSSTVMLGVAAEHTFLKLLETIENNPTQKEIYKNVNMQKTILQKFNKYQKILEQKQKTLPIEIKEDIDTTFAGILSIIRTFRNESGHPTGKIISREQCHVLLSIYPNYCKKVYQMIEYYKGL